VRVHNAVREPKTVRVHAAFCVLCMIYTYVNLWTRTPNLTTENSENVPNGARSLSPNPDLEATNRSNADASKRITNNTVIQTITIHELSDNDNFM